MSGTNKRSRATPFQIDEDLLCLICMELVDQAKQANCCGGLFCGACIDNWLNRRTTNAGQGCPQCRVFLLKSDVIPDVRSDRKSAMQPRWCPFHELHGCEYYGTRQQVAEHKNTCPYDPKLCTSLKCKNEKASLVAKHASDKAQLERIVNANSASTRQALVAAAWMSPEEILRKACGLDGVKMFTIDFTNACPEYSIAVRKNSNGRASPEDVNIVVKKTAGCYRLHCDRRTGQELPVEGLRRLKVAITLIPFDCSAIAEHTSEHVFERLNGFIWLSWRTAAEFGAYVKDDKFALGWKTTVLP